MYAIPHARMLMSWRVTYEKRLLAHFAGLHSEARPFTQSDRLNQ